MLRYGAEMYFIVSVGFYEMFENLKKAAVENTKMRKI